MAIIVSTLTAHSDVEYQGY